MYLQRVFLLAVEEEVAVVEDELREEGMLCACFGLVESQREQVEPGLERALEVCGERLGLGLEDFAERGDGVVAAVAVDLVGVIFVLGHRE